jgi:hypothetical protein
LSMLEIGDKFKGAITGTIYTVESFDLITGNAKLSYANNAQGRNNLDLHISKLSKNEGYIYLPNKTEGETKKAMPSANVGKAVPKLSDYNQKLYDEHVEQNKYNRMGEKTSVVLLTLKNGFEVVGTSACVNPADFDYGLGHHYALIDALHKVDELVGYARQESAHHNGIIKELVHTLKKHHIIHD